MHTIVTFESTDMLGDPRRVQMQATTLLEYAHSEGPCPRASGADNYHRWVCVRARGRSYSMAPSSKHVDNDSETCLRVSAQLNGSELKPTESEQRAGCCRPEALVPPLWDTNQLNKKKAQAVCGTAPGFSSYSGAATERMSVYGRNPNIVIMARIRQKAYAPPASPFSEE